MKKTIFLATLCFAYNSILAQPIFDESVEPSYAKIKSIKIESVVKTQPSCCTILIGPQRGDTLSNPVFALEKDKGLCAEFDLLENEGRNLALTIFRCDQNWGKSNLPESDYWKITDDLLLDGDLVDCSYQTNTPYYHYFCHFPLHEFEILLSGNYIFQIYETNYPDYDSEDYEIDDTDYYDDEYNTESYEEENDVYYQDSEWTKIFLQKRFVVSEQLVEINSKVIRPNLAQYSNKYQQITTEIKSDKFDLTNNANDIFVIYRQNGQWNQTTNKIQPNKITKDGKLIFDDNENALFLGGNEFHKFYFGNLKKVKSPVKSIKKINGEYELTLKPDRITNEYNKSGIDMNGKFLIREENHKQTCDYHADYANVKFTLLSDKKINDTLDVYILGEFNDWKLTDENKMTYNETKRQYEASILLKQGYYSYQYVLATKDLKYIDYTGIDGSYYQTENDYEIFVYYHDNNKNIDRCIGYKKIKSDFK